MQLPSWVTYIAYAFVAVAALYVYREKVLKERYRIMEDGDEPRMPTKAGKKYIRTVKVLCAAAAVAVVIQMNQSITNANRHKDLLAEAEAANCEARAAAESARQASVLANAAVKGIMVPRADDFSGLLTIVPKNGKNTKLRETFIVDGVVEKDDSLRTAPEFPLDMPDSHGGARIYFSAVLISNITSKVVYALRPEILIPQEYKQVPQLNCKEIVLSIRDYDLNGYEVNVQLYLQGTQAVDSINAALDHATFVNNKAKLKFKCP
jgi:uncharacterized membrane protein